MEFVDVHDLKTHPGVVAKGRVDVHTSILRELHAMSTNFAEAVGYRSMEGDLMGLNWGVRAYRQKPRFRRSLGDVDGDFAENDHCLSGTGKGGLMPRSA